jgi:hypothetical protein
MAGEVAALPREALWFPGSAPSWVVQLWLKTVERCKPTAQIMAEVVDIYLSIYLSI